MTTQDKINEVMQLLDQAMDLLDIAYKDHLASKRNEEDWFLSPKSEVGFGEG